MTTAPGSGPGPYAPAASRRSVGRRRRGGSGPGRSSRCGSGASRSSSRRFSRMSRLSKLSRKSGSSSVGSSRTSRLVKSTRPSRSYWREQRPQDAAGDALDEVVAVEERAAVDGEEAHVGRPGRRAARRGRCGRAAGRPSATRSSARIVSTALATSDATTVSAASSASAEGRGRPRLDREHADELAERHRRHRHPALGRGQAGQRRSRGRVRSSPESSNDRRTVREYFVIWRRLPTRIGAARAAAMPMTPSPTRHLGADALGLVAVAGDREQPGPVLVEQQQHRVLVAEQLGQAVDGDAHERVEVAAPAEPGAQLAERRGAGRCRRAGGATSGSDGGAVGPLARRDLLDVDDAVDVGGPQPEHVLHAGQRGDRVDVVCAAGRRPARAARCARTRAVSRYSSWVRGSTQQQATPVGFSARLRAVFEKNWFDSAIALVVDGVDLRQVGHVRHAVGRRGGEDRRDGALEAAGEVGRGVRPSALTTTRRRAPAPGRASGRRPRSTSTVTATKSAGTEPAPSAASVDAVDRRRTIGEERVAERRSDRSRSSSVGGSRSCAVPLSCTEWRVRTSAPVTAIANAGAPSPTMPAAAASAPAPTSTRTRGGSTAEHVECPRPRVANGSPSAVHQPDDRGATGLEEAPTSIARRRPRSGSS